MTVNNLTGQNIQDTYQRVVQTDGTNLADGTGSLLPISFDGNNVIISGSLSAIEYTVTSSVTNVIYQQQSGSTIFGDSLDDTHKITGSLSVTGSADINGLEFLGNPNTQGIATGLPEAIKLRGSDTTRIDFNANNLTFTSGIPGPASTFVTSLGIPQGRVVVNPENHSSVNFQLKCHMTASGNISASLTSSVKAGTGSFGRLEGLSPIVIGSDVSFTNTITANLDGGTF